MDDFHILTWNVNGLRSVLRKAALKPVLALQPDVICLQEIKAKPDQISTEELQDWNGYRAFWNPAQRAGYSGVLTLCKIPDVEVQHGIGVELFDIEGRSTKLDFPAFSLFNIYFPNGQRGHDRLGFKLDFYRDLLELCDEYHRGGKQIILTGDFNTAHREIDLRNPRQNVNTSGFMPVERAWIDTYIEHGFRDAFRELYPEREEYTWWTYISNARLRNVGWRLDYYLVSESLLPRVRDVRIHGEIMGSDHCPVSMWLKVD